MLEIGGTHGRNSVSGTLSPLLQLANNMMKLNRIARSLLFVACFCGFAGCDRKTTQDTPTATTPPSTKKTVAATLPAGLVQSSPAVSKTLFTEITGEAGFEQNPKPYPDGTFNTPEITPGGIALLDVENKGRLDILMICHPAPGPDQFKKTAPNRLFRQGADGTFTEVPNAGGLAGIGYHHGVAVGDIDNDGFPEVYVTNYASADQLFHNNGDGTFTDITAKANITSKIPPELNWASTAAFVDYDGDGFLDLVVVHFATFDPRKICQTSNDALDRDYCGPHMFPGQLLTLYHNNGNGTFTDVTRQVGLDTPGRGWGLIAAPITADGPPEILQANDEEPNQLWVNQGNGQFIDEAVLRGVGFNASGSVEANMGVTIGDVFNRGALDVFITHITTETNTLFKNNGDGTFADVTPTAGMGPIDRPFTGWGTGLFDFDNDGNLDIAVANGRVAKGPSRADATLGKFWSQYAEPNLLFRGDGNGHFTDVSASAGAFTQRPEVHRSMAFGDLFNRGRFDIVTMNLDNTLRIYRNDAASSTNHWLQVLPMLGKREAIGAKVYLTAGGKRRTAVCMRAYGYLASNDPKVHFGLGGITSVDTLEVVWPSGKPKREKFQVTGVDQVLKVRQGEGKE